jgi:hypothetical protein
MSCASKQPGLAGGEMNTIADLSLSRIFHLEEFPAGDRIHDCAPVIRLELPLRVS